MFSLSGETSYLYIDGNDTEDSVMAKIDTIGASRQTAGLSLLRFFFGTKDGVRTGRYEIRSDMNALTLFRILRNGMQTPVRLTIPSVRTPEKMAAFLGRKLMTDSLSFIQALQDSVVCASYGFAPHTMMALFVPNTYEVYWDIPIDRFLTRMKKEYETFWNDERLALAEKAGLSPVEVVTLASIVDEETANGGEKPRIAGMYLNRLRCGMPLQADPTVKFAWKRFELKRIYHNLLTIDNPYNTYRYEGLPPGPIRVPSVEGVDAVLHHETHNYLYMCAKEDFSGTHNFAATYAEHKQNARRYTEALNRMKVK